jgi:hypothetical protein
MAAHAARLRAASRQTIDEQRERKIATALRNFRTVMRARRMVNPDKVDAEERELEERLRGKP